MPGRSSSRVLLAGDVGGTKTAVALFQARAAGLHLVREEVLPSAEFKGLEAVLRRFLGEAPAPRVAAACFGGTNDQCDDHGAPCSTHCLSTLTCCAVNFLLNFGGGMTSLAS